ncbi:uncharacterized protein [Hetaerina americana]|uniref:uncharacterized protein isoform X2 n=1 Tax=Hetaerina americana TaxID=62018 RepID=UPI003A7F58F7
MSRFWATCFGGSEEQASPRRRRRPGVDDSDTDSSYDTDNDESDFEDGMKKFSIGERRQIGPGMFHREEDIRLEDVISSGDFMRDGAVRGRGEISVLDVPSTRVSPGVTQFVELVLKESQRGPPNQPQSLLKGAAAVGSAVPTQRPPPRMDTILPQVSLLREASRRQVVAPRSEFFVSGKGEERKRVNSGGSISSSGSSDGESEGSSSTSSGIGDSFASGNDTGGSGKGRLEGGANGSTAFQIGNGMRSKANGPRREKNHWSRDTLQDVVVEDVDGSQLDQFKQVYRERNERHPLSLVEGVHMPSHHREWGARRLYESELPTNNAPQFGNGRFTRY